MRTGKSSVQAKHHRLLCRGGKGCRMDAAERQQKSPSGLLTPKGMELALAVEDIYLSPDCVRCAIRKETATT